MILKIERQIEDSRGKIIFLSHGDKEISLVEIKKGHARGGVYHNFETKLLILNGKIEYREENIHTGKEQIKILESTSVILIEPEMAHIFKALEDSIFVEIFPSPYSATKYAKYRSVIERGIQS